MVTIVRGSVLEQVSVADFGAIGGNAAIDTAAFQAAFALVGEAGGNKVKKVIINHPSSGLPYRLNDRILIDDVSGLTVEADAAWVARDQYIIEWYGDAITPVFQFRGYTAPDSNPNFDCVVKNVGVDAFADGTHALAAFYVGTIDADTDQPVLNRGMDFEHCISTGGRFGLISKNFDGSNTDNALIRTPGCRFSSAQDANVSWASGNAILQGSGLTCQKGGTSPTTDTYNVAGIGANVHCESGYIDLVTYISAGSGVDQPTDADVYQTNGRVNITGAWSDTHGVFYDQVNGNYPSNLTGIRHFEGSMTVGTTPDSIKIRVPGTTIVSSQIFGNLELVSGLGGRPVITGITFIDAASTFTGAGVTSQMGLINIGSRGNDAQMQVGGGGTRDFDVLDFAKPFMSVNGAALAEAHGSDTGDSGFVIGAANPVNGSFELLSNCYKASATTYKAFAVGRGTTIIVGNGGMQIRSYNFTDTTTAINTASFQEGGRFRVSPNGYPILLMPKNSAAPTDSAASFEGAMYFNTTTNVMEFSNGTVWGAV